MQVPPWKKNVWWKAWLPEWTWVKLRGTWVVIKPDTWLLVIWRRLIFKAIRKFQTSEKIEWNRAKVPLLLFASQMRPQQGANRGDRCWKFLCCWYAKLYFTPSNINSSLVNTKPRGFAYLYYAFVLCFPLLDKCIYFFILYSKFLRRHEF